MAKKKKPVKKAKAELPRGLLSSPEEKKEIVTMYRTLRKHFSDKIKQRDK